MDENEKQKLMLLGLSHISLGTKDLPGAELFYTKILCGEVVFRFINADTDICYGIFISMGNSTFLEIFNDIESSSKVKADFPYRHICFHVESVEQTSKWLNKYNISSQISFGKKDNVKQFFINGTDDVLIEFHEYNHYSPQYKFLKIEK